ncbi:MAG: Monooxygenase [Paucimonas sp.]|nr:Monooxygenase [Paucimonas sp.]
MRHVEIAGAGFAGMTAAIAFAQRGWSVRLHERAAEPRAFGAGIFIWENGLRVLKAVGALEVAMQNMHEAPNYWARDQHGGIVGEYFFGPEAGTRMITMTRQNLHMALLDAALKSGVELQCNSEAIGADPSGVLHMADGRALEADLVVATDGVNSKVRDSLGLRVTREQVGHGAVRLLLRRTEEEVNSIEGNAVIFNRDAGTRRLLQVPCDKENLYLCFSTSAADEAGRQLPVRKDVWTQSFPHLRALLERVGEQGRFDLFEVSKLDSWSKGRVAIVGDAAHSMTPALGQGAGCAMMNALSLATHVSAGTDLEYGLRNWESLERPLTEHTQDYALQLTLGSVAASAGGTKWTPEAMRTAVHVPTGSVGNPSEQKETQACM